MSRERRILYVPLLAAALGVVSAAPIGLAAQKAPHKGELVRIVSPPATPGQPDSVVTGNLVQLVNDTVIIDAGWTGLAHKLLAFDVEGDTQLQTLQAGHPHLWGVLGAVVGGLAGGTLANATYPHPDLVTKAQYTVAGAILGGASGALIGILIDSRHPGGHWVPVDTHGIQVALGPAGIGLRAEF